MGSYKLGELHKDTFLMLLNALMNDLKLYIDKYILKQFVEYNFPADSKGHVPKVTFNFEKQGTSSVAIVLELVKQMLAKSKVDIDIEDLVRLTGVPLKEAQVVDPTIGVKEGDEKGKEKEGDKKQEKIEERNPVVVNVAPIDMADKFLELKADILSAMDKKGEVVVEEKKPEVEINVPKDKFYDEILSLASAQVGRVSEFLSNNVKEKWVDVKLGYRAKMEKVWAKYVGEDLGSVYDGATLILEGVVKSGGMVSDVRNKLWDMLSKYYLTCAYKRNSKLMIGMANKLSDVISETI